MKKYLFIDRDGTLVYEPEDFQVDALDKVKFLPHVIPALLRLQEAGYRLVMVSNQDGLGTESFPLETFTPAHELILNTLESQGINFEQVLICPHKPEDNCDCRKPKLGLVQAYLNDDSWDRATSYFIGDRPTDLAMAAAMGIKGLKVGDFANADSSDEVPALTWDEIVATILNVGPVRCRQMRTAHVVRTTRETKIDLTVDLDHSGHSSIATGIGFFDHMLDQIATHGNFNLTVKVEGDLEVDGHHTIEDTAIVLGEAVYTALGSKLGIERYGYCLPMDECDATVLIDFGGRIDFAWNVAFHRERVGDVPTEMFRHFFKSFTDAAHCNLHITATGENEHHKIEGIFKAFSRALRMAASRNSFKFELPSSKGML